MSDKMNGVEEHGISRRRFMRTGAAALAGVGSVLPGVGVARSQIGLGRSGDPAAFFLVADTHYDARVGEKTDELVPEIHAINQRLLELINELPGTAMPDSIGGTEVTKPQIVVHMGDMIDSGDKGGRMWEDRQHTEWEAYVKDYGLNGDESSAILDYPIFELFGNHDSTREWTAALVGCKERLQRRRGVLNIEPEHGLHYSWDAAGIHFIALGHIIGHNPDGRAHGRMEAFNSYEFLVSDLARHVGDSGRPVILMQHIDLWRFSGEECDPESTGRDGSWWHPCDVKAYHRAIQPYNIAGIFHGHLHSRQVGRWDGSANRETQSGPPVLGSSNSGAHGRSRGFFYCRVEDNKLVTREIESSHGDETWARGKWDWTDQVWEMPLNLPALKDRV